MITFSYHMEGNVSSGIWLATANAAHDFGTRF
jgi:hypothetical protein